MKQRMFSVLEIKSFDDDERIIEGIATTPSTDRQEDQVVPTGAKFALPIPLLWQHDSSQPIGTVLEAKVTEAGIWIRAQLAQIAEPGTLKNRLDEAWQSIKSGLVRGFSIGFRGLEVARIEGSFGLKFLSWEWLELSAVTIPANAQASIQTIKSFDEQQQRAAPGQSVPPPVVQLDPPGAAGSNTTTHSKPQEGKMKTVREQIEGYTNMRAAKAARLDTLMQKAAEEGRTLNETESQEYDTAQGEIESIDTHLVRLNALEKSQVTNATRVTVITGNEQNNGVDIRRGADIVNLKSNLPKGSAFTRMAMTMMMAKGNLPQALELSKRFDESTPEVGRILKAAVAAGTTTDPSWAGPLVDYQNVAGEFIELLRPETILGKLTKLRNVPFNIKIPGQTSGSTAAWVGEGSPKPVGKLGFNQITMRFKKVAGIVVMSDELVRFSNPSAEALVRDDLIATIALVLDNSLVDPASAEITDVKPASLTNGVTAIPSSGNDLDAVKTDVRAVFAEFIAANLSVTSAAWLMSGTTALALSEMETPLGNPAFPGLTMEGGTFKGLPAIVSETVGDKLILVKQSEILLADDGQVVIDASAEASLEMADNPTGTGTLKSLWQNNLLGLRAERFINWKKRRPEAVAYVSGVAYGQPDAG